jgi:hypothetical protein
MLDDGTVLYPSTVETEHGEYITKLNVLKPAKKARVK